MITGEAFAGRVAHQPADGVVTETLKGAAVVAFAGDSAGAAALATVVLCWGKTVGIVLRMT
jgi:hypothetical protein